MAILDRLHTLIRSEVSHLTGRRPQREDAHAAVREARASLAELYTRERREHRAYQDLLDHVQALEDRAVAALRIDDEAAARVAIDEKHRADDRADAARRALDQTRRELGDLRAALTALEFKLQAGADRRAAERRTASTAPGVTPGGPYADPAWGAPAAHTSDSGRQDRLARARDAVVDFAAPALERFDAIASRLDDIEANVQADVMLDSEGRNPDDPLHDHVDARFRELELERMRGRTAADDATGDDDDPLSRLRRRMGGDDG